MAPAGSEINCIGQTTVFAQDIVVERNTSVNLRKWVKTVDSDYIVLP